MSAATCPYPFSCGHLDWVGVLDARYDLNVASAFARLRHCKFLFILSKPCNSPLCSRSTSCRISLNLELSGKKKNGSSRLMPALCARSCSRRTMLETLTNSALTSGCSGCRSKSSLISSRVPSATPYNLGILFAKFFTPSAPIAKKKVLRPISLGASDSADPIGEEAKDNGCGDVPFEFVRQIQGDPHGDEIEIKIPPRRAGDR